MPEEMWIPLQDGVRLYAEAYGDACEPDRKPSGDACEPDRKPSGDACEPDRKPSGDTAAPVTVVLLHGWTLDRHIWHRQVTGLRDEARVVVYDARGHGRSGPARRRTFTLAQLGDDLAEVLRAVAPDGPVVLAGHSLGGMTIMEYAHRHPDEFARRVAGMVLVSTTAEGARHTTYGLPHPLARVVRVAEVAGAGLLAYLGAWRPHRMLQLPLRPGLRWLLFGDPADPADVRLATTSVAGTSLCAIGGFRSSIGAQRRLETLAALPTVPTVIMVGDRDRITPRACSEAIAAAVPGAELAICEGAGHMLTLERAGQVTGTLTKITRDLFSRVVPRT